MLCGPAIRNKAMRSDPPVHCAGRVLTAMACLALQAGCATLTTGSSQTLTIVSDPPGAACVLQRDGGVIGAVNPTPGSILISKSHSEVRVQCTRDGYLKAEQSVGAAFQAATLGNVLLGGLIGIVVDAASGASASYEPQLLVLMVPAEFATAAERDRFFEARRDRLAELRRQQEAQIKQSCRADECDRLLKKLEEGGAQALAVTERQHADAKLRPAG